MSEEEFINEIDEIDCHFPYLDEPRWKAVIKLGSQLSPNAAFVVLEESSRPPASANASVQQLGQILEYWYSEVKHPLAESVWNVATKLIRSEELGCEEAITIMKQIALHLNLYGALNILYFSCDDKDGSADETYKTIVNRWETRN